MISIQTLGLQILNHTPLNFYAFGGTEYGIKMKYIEELSKYYGNKIEIDSVMSILDMFSTKHLIPLKPAVYIARYDDEFALKISEPLAARIKRTNIVGTIVCLYEKGTIISKMNKYLPDNTALIEQVDKRFVKKYLKTDFPKLDDSLVDLSIKASDNYGQAKLMCNCLNKLDQSKIDISDLDTITKLVGYQDISTEKQLRIGIASRNFNYLMKLMETYAGEYDNIFYTIINVMTELDKIKESKYSDSELKPYSNRWTGPDLYYYTMHTYEQLKLSRQISTSDISNSIVYLFGLLGFERIPSIEVMNNA